MYCAPEKPTTHIRQRRFTLVEILVVLVIFSIITGLGLSLYSQAGHRQSSKGGARRMADMVALARQKAILENTRVALLLPQMSSIPNPNYYGSSDSPGRDIGFCEVDKTGGFVRWIEGAPWIKMPEQAYFTTSNLWSVTGVDLPNNSATTSNAVIFMPNGTLLSNKFKNGASIWVKPLSTSSERYEPGAGLRYSISVNWLTGATTTESHGG